MNKYEIDDFCCLNCRCVVDVARDWESFTLYCLNCGGDMNDPELYFDDDDE